jgi:hypothetical protein
MPEKTTTRRTTRARLAWGAAAIVLGAAAVAWGTSHRTRASDSVTNRSSPPEIAAPAQSVATAEPQTPQPSPRPPSDPTLHVPRAKEPITINAETEGKKIWEGEVGTTLNFVDRDGHGMVPYTEAKVRWGDGRLYFLLYAGDLDLEGTITQHDGPVEKDDSFRLEIGSGEQTRVIAVSVLGTVADSLCTGPVASAHCDSHWESHARVAVDRDGTMNKIGDNDEEWVVEMAVPFASLGLAHAGPGTKIPFSIARCEMEHRGQQACGAWGKGEKSGELVLDP